MFYSLTFDNQYFETLYYLSANNKIVEYSQGNFRAFVEKIDYKSHGLLFSSFEEVEVYVSELESKLFDFEDNSMFKSLFLFKVQIHRLKRPTNIPNKTELEFILKNGDDSQTNKLFLDVNGHFHLVPLSELTGISSKQYAIRGEEFGAYRNSVGPYARLTNLDGIFKGFLSAWLRHLQYDKVQRIDDWLNEDLQEESLFKEIENAMNKYQ